MAKLGDDAQIIERTRNDVKEPGMFHVIFLNDNLTPMDFVIEVLMKIFSKNENEAINLMMKVHNEGSAVVGTYIEDVAQTKSEITKKIAKSNGFPLQTKVQPA